MRCGTARKHVYLARREAADEAEFPVEAEVAAARRHVERCGACREFLESEERIACHVKLHAPRAPMPAAARARILRGVSEEGGGRRSAERRSRARRGYAIALACALAAAIFVFALWRQDRGGASEIVSILVEDHSHNLSAAMEIASSDPDAVRSWFRGRVDFALHLPSTAHPSLAGGRLCNLRGRRAALVLYQEPESAVSLFVFDGSGVELPEDRLVAVDGRRCLMAAERGLNVVLWKDRGLLYGLVSEARGADLLQFASQF